MTLKHALTIFMIMALLVSCGGTSNSTDRLDGHRSGPKPSWLIEQPVDPNYYLGIGSAAKTQYGAEAQKSAQDLALADLASQITVTISSDIVTSLIEKGAITEEEYMATTRSKAVADLEGHELVDTWQDAHYHYAYFRLSKATYAAIQARKRQAAIALSSDYLSKAEIAAAQYQFANSFNALIQAFLPLLPYLNEALQADYEGRSVILSNEVNTQLQNLLENITLMPSSTNVEAKLGRPINSTLTVVAKTVEGNALRGLPLKVAFKKGSGELVDEIITNNQGVASLEISNITAPVKLQILEVSVDVDQLIAGINSPLLTVLVNNIPPSNTRIILEVINPYIYLESSELFDGRALPQLQVEPQLKNHFITEGFNFVDEPDQADWQMTLSASASKGTEYSGMFTTFANVSLSVIDRQSGAEIYKNSLSRVKGIDLSYDNAANKAFANAAEELNATIIPEILESIK